MKLNRSIVIFATTLLILRSYALESEWVEPESGNWTDSSKWSTPTFPDNTMSDNFDAIINATGFAYDVTLNSNIALDSLKINSADAALLHNSGTLTIGGDLNVISGEYRLNGGTISGANIIPGGSFTFTSSINNTLSNNAVFNGDLNLDSGTVRLQSDASFTGDANLTGGTSRVVIEDTTTLTGNTINIDAGSNAALSINGSYTLTLGSDTLVRGRGNIGTWFGTAGTRVLINDSGTIRADLGQNLNIAPNEFFNEAEGTVEAINSSTLILNADHWSNHGQINASDGSTVNFNNSWSNAGGSVTVDATSTLNLNGTSTPGLLGVIDNSAGGTVNINGTIDNTGANFTLNAATGSWTLNGGTISGGQIFEEDGQQLIFTSNFDNTLSNNAVFNGDINLDTANLRLQSGASFTGDAYLTGGPSRLVIEDTTTLTGNTINIDAGSNAALSINGSYTLTLGSDTLVRGRGNIGTWFGTAGTRVLINDSGTIRADLGQNLNIAPNEFSNEAGGTVEAINGSNLNLNADNWSNLGQINASDSSTVNFNNSWSNAGGSVTVDATSTLNLNGTSAPGSLGTIDNSAGGTVNINGTIDNTGANFTLNAATGSWTLNGGTISGGQIFEEDGQQLIFSSSINNTLSNNAVFNGDVNLDSANLRLQSGATFTGDANLTGGASRLIIDDTTMLTGNTINLDGSRIPINGSYTLTLGSDTLVRGRGNVGDSFGTPGTRILINEAGTIRADIDGQTLTIGPDVFFNESGGTVEAANGGTLALHSSTDVVQYTGDSLTDGIWRVFDNSTLRISTDTGTGFLTNAADITLSGGNSVLIAGAGSATIDDRLTNNTGAFRILDGRDFTAPDDFTNSGVLQLGGTSIDAPSLSNSGEIFGHGSIDVRPLNTGTIRAEGGTLTMANGIQGGSGTVQIDAGGSLDISGGADDSSADFLVHNGDNLHLGSNNFLVEVDYTNANFGSGNSFDRRANVTGMGEIRADGDSALGFGGDVEANVLDFGNVHVGTTQTLNYTVANTGTEGADLRGAIQDSVNGGSITDGQLSGAGVSAGNFGPVSTGDESSDFSVTLDASAAGALSGQTINVTSNFDNVADTQLGITGTAYRLADPSAHTPGQIDFGNVHVGASTSQALTLTNNATNDGFSEALNAEFTGTTGGVTTSGSFDLLGPEATDDSSLTVGIDTATAGNQSGTATLGLTSDGSGSSELGQTALADQTVNVTGSVFRLAEPSGHTPDPVDFGNVHVGDSATQALTLTNTAADDGFSEALNAEFTGTTGSGVSASGSFDQLGPEATDSSNLIVGIDTATAGNQSGTATLGLTSDGSGSSGLGQTALADQTVNVTGSVFRLAEPSAHTPDPVDLGNVHVGATATQALTLSNNADDDGFSEALNAEFTGTTGSATTSGSFDLLGPEATDSSNLIVGIDTAAAGNQSGTATLALTSDGSGSSGLGQTALAGQTVNVTGSVFRLAEPSAHAPDPVNFGNVHVGDSATQALTLTNTAVADGFSEALNAEFTGTTGSATASGSFDQLSPEATDSSLTVGINTATAGNQSGTATLGLTSDGSGSSGLGQTALADQTVNVTGSVFRLAEPSGHTPDPVDFGNVHVGDSATQALTLTNTAADDGFSEALNAEFTGTTGSGVSASGSFDQLGPEATDSSSLTVGINTATAGNQSGTATLALTSDGSGSSGLGQTALADKTVNVTGSVFLLAAANTIDDVNLGTVRVNQTATSTLSISNISPDTGGFTETLAASFSSTSGVNTTGSIAGLESGDTSTAMSVSVDTEITGLMGEEIHIDLSSLEVAESGLGTTDIGSQIINVTTQVNHWATPNLKLQPGEGDLVQNSANEWTLDFGTLTEDTGEFTAFFAIENFELDPVFQDSLGGSFLLDGSVFTLTGFDTFDGIAPGDEQSGFQVTLDTHLLDEGLYSGSVIIALTSSNASSTGDLLDPVTLDYTATVIPEPSTFLLALSALLPLLGRLRNRMKSGGR
ncbi:MAG: choice-of-anchor D domain-containing protein [Opitutales bacterium]|nr:choice-of-anchor D domain-containing protein [Opitutales bacterium]